MSGEAMGWAMRQSTGDCSSQFVLLLLAMRADENGAMTEIDADYFAERACLSRATVFRVFRRLRDLGVFETETGFSRSGGRAVSGRLRLDATAAGEAMQETQPCESAPEAPAGGGSLKLRLPESGEVVSNCDQGSLKLRLPTLCSNSLINNPPNPPNAGAPNAGADEDGLDAWCEQFQAVYPFDATMTLADTRREAARLSIKDRAKALRWAPEYSADLKRRGATRPLDAARWLRERRFDEIERIKGGQARAIGLEKPLVFVAKGTRAWDAWVAKGGHKPGLDTSRHLGKTGWWFPALWPPGVDPPAGGAEGA